MELIDGKMVSKTIKAEKKQEVEKIKQEGGKIPHLAAVLIGHHPASETYVASKVRTCEQIGFKSTQIRREDTITEQELLDIIDTCNADDDIDGILVQLPLPGHISEQKVIEHIDYMKDVDGFHPVNTGKMVAGMPAFVSATPAGILELLKRYKIQTEGKHCVVLGRSNIVGTPVSILMSRKTYPGNSTVTVCHSRTQNLKEITSQAHILIAAIGKKEFVTADMVKEGAIVIDVGIHREKSTITKSGWKLRGDVKFDEVSKKCSYITPVPGGIGPMTIAALMMNTLKASKQKNIS
jgi:methylenetetrahydrofolate dehydrogenase (NADP+) / methenyltetrahydrofolate cyclohydrolase